VPETIDMDAPKTAAATNSLVYMVLLLWIVVVSISAHEKNFPRLFIRQTSLNVSIVSVGNWSGASLRVQIGVDGGSLVLGILFGISLVDNFAELPRFRTH